MPAASGSVTYTLYTDNQCTQQAASGGTVSVANGVAAASSPLVLADGTYYLVVSYSGDASHAPVTSGCGVATLTVGGTPQPQECNDLASVSPGFASAEQELLPLPALSSDTLEVAVTAGISLGSVGVCDNALSGLVPSGSRAGLTADYNPSSGTVASKFTYSFVPLRLAHPVWDRGANHVSCAARDRVASSHRVRRTGTPIAQLHLQARTAAFAVDRHDRGPDRADINDATRARLTVPRGNYRPGALIRA